jgi:hypothetical protein
MRTGAIHVLTETAINEVPADSSRVSVRSWWIRNALKEPHEGKERSDEEPRVSGPSVTGEIAERPS